MIVDRIDFDLLAIILAFLLICVGILFPVLYLKYKKGITLKWIAMVYRWRLLRYFFILFAIYIGLVFLIYSSTVPKIIRTYPEPSTNWDTYRNPIEVEFNVPVMVGELEPNINPSITGTWVWEPYLGSVELTRRGTFHPLETFFPDQRVVVYIIGVSRLLHDENHEMGVDFQSIKTPVIQNYIPENGNEKVTRDQEIVLELSNENDHAIEYRFKIEPEIDLDISDIYSSRIFIKPKNSFSQDTEYTLTVYKRAIRYGFETNSIIEYSEDEEQTETYKFKTVKAPFIDEFSPEGTGVKEDATIEIKFSSAMDRTMVEETIKFDPEIEGAFEWSDDMNLTFTPTSVLPKETEYKVIFPAGLKNSEGGMFEEDAEFKFTTIGGVKVTEISPSNNSVGLAEDTNVRVSFDQEVDKESAQQHFSISPAVNGTMNWDGNTLIFDPEHNLGYSTTYEITIAPGIKSIYGLDGKDEYKSKFTIRADQIVIGGIPNYYQPQPSFSCNIYSTMMVLAWKGHYPSVTQLIAEIGYNTNQSNGQWTGNPYKEFVGNSDGSWGYGVYWDPISRILANRGVRSELHQNWNLSAVAREVAAGRPVIIWRYNGESADYDRDWVASDGTYIEAINGQHGGVITGFRGSVNSPTAFYLNDSWYGPGWYSTEILDYFWSRMGRVGLVIH